MSEQETKVQDGTAATRDFRDGFKRMMEESAARMEAAFAEASRAERAGLEQAKAAIDNAAKLQKDTLAYATELTAEWQKLALEMTRRAAAFTTSFGDRS